MLALTYSRFHRIATRSISLSRFHQLYLLPLLLLLIASPAVQAGSNVHLRGDLNNSRIRFEREKKGHVAFMGGSITEMNGYRPMVMANLQKRFAKTKFKFTSAGISSTCSTTGAFRLQRDVLSQGPVDLFFVEFAVNDDQDAGHAERASIRGMEGIVRHLRTHNPKADIVIVYFVNPGMLKLLTDGKAPTSIAAHDKVAKHYGVSVIHLAKETAERIKVGKMTWAQFGGTHPKKPGNALCASLIETLFGRTWQKPLIAKEQPKPHALPARSIDDHSYANGRFITPSQAKADKAWQWSTPTWKSLPGQCRGRFVKMNLLHAANPGDSLTLSFEGTAIGAYVLAGPDAGTVEASVDGGKFNSINLYHKHSGGLHYPRTVMFDADLKPGKHELKLRISKARDARSKGAAVRILQFVAN